MRLSRHCYDKPHRCPGWNGGGFKYSTKEDRCNGGHIVINYNSRWSRNWTFHRCDTCDVVCWPIVIQQLDPSYWRHWHWYRTKMWAQERLLWPLQKALVIGLYTRPLRFETWALKLDQRWNTSVWEPLVPEGEEQDSDNVH